jgi:hypothetical protein
MVIQHVLQYLVDHPDAKDTVQGIVRWWLPRGLAAWEEEAVQAALNALVARGWLTQRQTTTSPQLYGVNKEKLEVIKAFLRKRESEAKGQGDGGATG